jgi:hypothetical protein
LCEQGRGGAREETAAREDHGAIVIRLSRSVPVPAR